MNTGNRPAKILSGCRQTTSRCSAFHSFRHSGDYWRTRGSTRWRRRVAMRPMNRRSGYAPRGAAEPIWPEAAKSGDSRGQTYACSLEAMNACWFATRRTLRVLRAYGRLRRCGDLL